MSSRRSAKEEEAAAVAATTKILDTERRLTQALEPQMSEWTASLTESEAELVAQVPANVTAAMFAIWLSDRIKAYGALWKGEWQRRLVAEASLREVKGDLVEVERKLVKVQGEVEALRRSEAEERERKEREIREGKENRGLKKLVGSVKWKHHGVE